MRNIDKKAVGGRIRTIRLDRGLTLEEFGKIFIDIAKLQNVRSWEIGQSLPNKERIKTICKLFDITRNELLYGTTEEQEHKKYKDFFEFVKEMALSGELDRSRILEKIEELEVKDDTKI